MGAIGVFLVFGRKRLGIGEKHGRTAHDGRIDETETVGGIVAAMGQARIHTCGGKQVIGLGHFRSAFEGILTRATMRRAGGKVKSRKTFVDGRIDPPGNSIQKVYKNRASVFFRKNMLIFSPFAHFPTKIWKIPFYRHNYCQHVLTPLPITIMIEKADRKDLLKGGAGAKTICRSSSD